MAVSKKFAESKNEFFSVLISLNFEADNPMSFPSRVFGCEVASFASCIELASEYFEDEMIGAVFTDYISKVSYFTKKDIDNILKIVFPLI